MQTWVLLLPQTLLPTLLEHYYPRSHPNYYSNILLCVDGFLPITFLQTVLLPSPYLPRQDMDRRSPSQTGTGTLFIAKPPQTYRLPVYYQLLGKVGDRHWVVLLRLPTSPLPTYLQPYHSIVIPHMPVPSACCIVPRVDLVSRWNRFGWRLGKLVRSVHSGKQAIFQTWVLFLFFVRHNFRYSPAIETLWRVFQFQFIEIFA